MDRAMWFSEQRGAFGGFIGLFLSILGSGNLSDEKQGIRMKKITENFLPIPICHRT